MPAAAFKTPGVYVEETSTLPPSVAEVSTAIPAFFGYTEKGANTIGRVTTLLEFEQAFGGAHAATFSAKIEKNDNDEKITVSCTPSPLKLYHAVSHYFKNGGGACYIVSVGDYTASPAAAHFSNMISELAKEDEPTLVVLTDALALSAGDYYALCEETLRHCQRLGDRFAILDVHENPEKGTDGKAVDPIAAFRNGVGMNNLAYGAAYYPNVETTLPHAFDEDDVEVSLSDAKKGSLKSLRDTATAAYQQIKKRIGEFRVVLPPSGAMAGVYASVDRDRGVWKAPANVSLSSVLRPMKKITNDEQDDLNVDATSGKSINAIRSFPGKGTIVWGARTLAGNDNEWRYVPVRRLFVMLEESARKATAFAVFEPNDTSTWLKVKGMLESFLHGLWERGALAGSTPEAAYFVQVGLGKTMTTQDVLEGRMIVKIGIAAVRPAEFIILQFSHKLQEA